MAKFITTTGISHHLEEAIKHASKRITLVSPYLKVNPKLKQLLEDADRQKLDIRIIYGKSELTGDESSWLGGTNIRTSYLDNLHAKCYLADDVVILTSMNLYEFSQVNNNEMGIYITREEDPQLFEEIDSEVQRFLRSAKELKVSVTAVQGKPTSKFTLFSRAKGVCIRCGDKIPHDKERPYCKDCFDIWKKFENVTYQEKFCHECGGNYATTMQKPLCPSCFDKSLRSQKRKAL